MIEYQNFASERGVCSHDAPMHLPPERIAGFYNNERVAEKAENLARFASHAAEHVQFVSNCRRVVLGPPFHHPRHFDPPVRGRVVSFDGFLVNVISSSRNNDAASENAASRPLGPALPQLGPILELAATRVEADELFFVAADANYAHFAHKGAHTEHRLVFVVLKRFAPFVFRQRKRSHNNFRAFPTFIH